MYNTEFSQYIQTCYYKNYETSHIEIIEDSTDAEKDMYNYMLYNYFPRNNIINSVAFYDTDEDTNEDTNEDTDEDNTENNNVENNDRMVVDLYDDDDDLFDDTFDD